MLTWKTLFAGQTAHDCPQCHERFRLTYAAKRRLAIMNLLLIIGFILVWNLPGVWRNLAVYSGIAVLTLWFMPKQAHYEKLSAPEH
jgi:hypothetical protein